MKRLCLSLVFVGLLSPLIFVPSLVLTGCQAPSAQRQTFNTIWTVAKTVNESWVAYCDLVIAGQLTTNDVPKMAERYNNFQLALKAASVGMLLNTNAPAPPELTAAADSFLSTFNDVKQ